MVGSPFLITFKTFIPVLNFHFIVHLHNSHVLYASYSPPVFDLEIYTEWREDKILDGETAYKLMYTVSVLWLIIQGFSNVGILKRSVGGAP